MTFSTHYHHLCRVTCQRLGIIGLLLGLLMIAPVESHAQIGSACDSIGITPEYDGPGCCWDFVLRNNSTFQPFNSIKATVLSSGGTVKSASGGFPTTTGAISATWTFPNNLGQGNTRIKGCFDSPGGTITLFFEWKYNGVTYCTDTLTLDCPDGPTNECDTDTLRISTGWNRYSGTLQNVGEWTSTWRVTGDPYPGTTEPRPAAVVAKDSLWNGPIGTSRWISSYLTPENDTIGTYTFETCFCVKGDAREVMLKMGILADDRARVYINGTQIGSNPATNGYTLPEGRVDVDITQYLVVGRNCLSVEVDNTNIRRMGLDVDGTITAKGLGLQRAACCEIGGDILGTKYRDINCNGERDPGEPGVPGFQIISTHGDTTFTDRFGNYYFKNVPAGVAILYEVDQPGWSRSYPTTEDGTHSVPVIDGSVSASYDFGNCREKIDTSGCFEYREDSTSCELSRVTGEGRYRHAFGIRARQECDYNQVVRFQVIAPQDVTLSQSNFLVSGTFYPQSFAITGPGAIPGRVVRLRAILCCVAGGGNGQPGDTIACCSEVIEITLPECDTTGGGGNDICTECCLDFPKSFPRLTQWSSSSGISSVTGMVSAGKSKICTVSATLVDAKVNGRPVYGQFVPSNTLGGQVGLTPSMHEVVWTGVDVSNGAAPFNLRIQFPGLSYSSVVDRLEYCVRFRFTDAECRTCDTLICFTQQRIRWIFPGGFGLPNGAESDQKGVTGESAAATTFEGSLTGSEAGELRVTFPEAPSQLGTVTYVGLEVQPGEEFVEITGATSAETTFQTFGFGVASIPFAKQANDLLSVEMTYNGLNNRNSLDHFVTLRFVSDLFPGDTLEESGSIRLLRTEFQGGDSLELGMKMGDVRTWALYLHNRNGSAQTLSRLQLETPEGIEILAVGPGPDQRSATIAYLGGERDAAAFDLGELATTLAPDSTIGPIYVTLAGTSNLFEVGFRTLNVNGQVITEGSITVDDDPSSVREGGDGRTGTGRLINGVYPNPVTGRTTVSFTLPRTSSNVELILLDPTGREVMRLLDRSTLRGGEQRLSFETEGLPSGSYHLMLRMDGTVESIPVQILD